MFYPFRNEDDLKSGNSGTYHEKLQEPGVLDVVNRNKQIFEPYGDLVDSALLNLRASRNSQDAFAEQENDEVQEQLLSDTNDLESEDPSNNAIILEDTNSVAMNARVLLSDDEINAKVRSLNSKQRQCFDIVHNWAKTYVKNLSVKSPIEIQPLYIFITGGAGTGKSHLIKTIYYSLTKTLSYRSLNAEKPKVLLTAPTGVAAVNIDGTTIHTALGLPVGRFGKTIPKLSDKRRTALRNRLCDVRVLIIDEISMVSNLQLLHIHLRLIEVFGCNDTIPFAGLTIIAVGDFYQLPPVQQRTVYADYKDTWQNMIHIWKLFKIVELDEVMRQRGDSELIDLLNKVRTATLDENDESLLKSKFIDKNTAGYPIDALHIYAENSPCHEHNKNMLDALDNILYTVHAIDEAPKNVSKDIIDKALSRNQSQTGGLAQTLYVKINARVMLTVNIDIADRLINGQIGTVKHITRNSNNTIVKIYIKFDDDEAGRKKIDSDCFAKQNMWVLIEKSEASVNLKINRDSSPIIKRTQFPLILSWACTVHKVQGLSLDKAVVSFNLLKQKSFNYGQMYVALSRVTSLNGLYLTGEFKRTAIKSDPRALQEYERMRTECLIQPFDIPDFLSNNTITITLLNTRSLQRHAADIASDYRFFNTDILCLTETQLLPNQNTNNIDDTLHNFEFLHNKCHDKFQSISIGYAHLVEIRSYSPSLGMSIIEFQSCIAERSIKLLVVYRKNNTCLTSFYNICLDILLEQTIDIVVGDFNINALDLLQSNRLQQVFHGYKQIVQKPTHLAGATLDHVYLRNDFMEQFDLLHYVISTYFSDHDAIQFRLSPKND